MVQTRTEEIWIRRVETCPTRVIWGLIFGLHSFTSQEYSWFICSNNYSPINNLASKPACPVQTIFDMRVFIAVWIRTSPIKNQHWRTKKWRSLGMEWFQVACNHSIGKKPSDNLEWIWMSLNPSQYTSQLFCAYSNQKHQKSIVSVYVLVVGVGKLADIISEGNFQSRSDWPRQCSSCSHILEQLKLLALSLAIRMSSHRCLLLLGSDCDLTAKTHHCHATMK